MENIIKAVSDMLSKLSFIPTVALQLASVGVVLLVLVFAIAAIISCFSKIKGLTKKILDVTVNLAKLERVDEENVEVLNVELDKLPEAVKDGWGRFMEQRIGYPSDYMKEKSVLDENMYTSKGTAGNIFFRIFGFLMVAVVAFLAVIVCAEDAASLGLKDFIDNFKVVGGIVGSVVVPILFFIIFDIIIIAIYRRQRKRLLYVYKSFQDNLDEKVVIYASEEEEFTSENLDEITKNIEEIIAQRMDKKEIIEVITAPKIDELETNIKTDIIEDALEVEEEVVAATLKTIEERENYLATLISIVESAIADPEVKTEDLEQIAELIFNSTSSFESIEDKSILDQCLQKLADVFYGKK